MAAAKGFSSEEIRAYLNRYSRLKETARKSGRDILLIDRAFAVSNEVHKGMRRKDGTPYMAHCVEVGLRLAQMNCDSETIAAGLLTGAQEKNCIPEEEVRTRIGEKTEQIVSAAKEIANLILREDDGLPEDEEELTERRARIEKIICSVPEALFVAVAERICTLYAMGSFDARQRDETVAMTNRLLIPIVRDLVQAYSLVDLLRDACLRAENDEYEEVKAEYKRILTGNSKLLERFAVYVQRETEEWNREEKYPIRLFFRDRSVYSVYNDMKRGANDALPDRILQKKTVPLQDMYFVVDDNCPVPPAQLFFDFYRKIRRDDSRESFAFTVVAFGESTSSGLKYLIGADRCENRWRIFCQKMEEFKKYCQGYGIRELRETGLGAGRISASPADPSSRMITVYTKDKNRVRIEEGATVLDLAFKIHSGLAFGAKHALISGRPDPVPLNERLMPGNIVEIVSSTAEEGKEYVDNATIRWLEFVNTRKARRDLVRHLEEKETWTRPLIMVTDADSGRRISLPYNATPVDLAFALEPGRAVFFREAVVGREKTPCGPDRALKNLDTVRLIYGEEPGARLGWLRHVQTEKAKNALIDYLESRDQESSWP